MSYVDDEIQVLSTFEAIRSSPALYAGELDNPTLFNRFIQEALCIAIDEAVSGHCTQMSVFVSKDWNVTVRDNGRGLSMIPNAFGQVPAEVMFSKLHACRHNKENTCLQRSCCEMGIVVVNALSERFCVRNFREGVCWVQEYRGGEAVTPFRRETETMETGLELSFQPDLSILNKLHFNAGKLTRWVLNTKAGFGSPTVTGGKRSGKPTVLLFEMFSPAQRVK